MAGEVPRESHQIPRQGVSWGLLEASRVLRHFQLCRKTEGKRALGIPNAPAPIHASGISSYCRLKQTSAGQPREPGHFPTLSPSGSIPAALPEIRLLSFNSSYNRPNSGIWFWLFSGELLKSCFRVWNPSFRHNLEIKRLYSNEKRITAFSLGSSVLTGRMKGRNGRKMTKKSKEKKKKTAEKERETKGRGTWTVSQTLCGALWTSFHFILT